MKRAIIIGSGGHSRVVLSLLFQVDEYRIEGILDLGSPMPGEKIMGIPVIGSIDRVGELGIMGIDSVFLAIGDNNSRRQWFDKLVAQGYTFPNLISPYAILDPSSKIGVGNVICARAFVGPLAVIGDNNLINTSAIVEHEVRIGNHCHLAPGSVVAGRCVIEDEVFLGANSTVKDRIMVGQRITVGAGATVVKTLEQSDTIYVGTPAQPRKPK